MPKPESACGTYAAYRRHLRRKEPVDDACLAARDAETESRRRARDETKTSVSLESNSGLASRGQAIFLSLTGDKDVPAELEALALETARMADRLEQLNDVIQGKGVLDLMRFRLQSAVDDAGVVLVEMKVDGVISEARQMQVSFERMVKASRVALVGDEATAEEVDPFDAFFSSGNVARFPTPEDRKQA